MFHSSDLIPYDTRVLDPEGMLPEVAVEDEPGGGGGGGGDGDGRVIGSRGVGRGRGKRVKRRARNEDPREPPPPPDEAAGEETGGTGDEPTVRDKILEMKWRHATVVEDRGLVQKKIEVYVTMNQEVTSRIN